MAAPKNIALQRFLCYSFAMFIKSSRINKAKRRAWEAATGHDRYFARERHFELKFMALGSYVRIAWRDEIRRYVRDDRAVQDQRFCKMYSTTAGGWSWSSALYADLKSQITQAWQPYAHAVAMLDGTPNGTQVGGWVKTTVPSNNDHSPEPQHFWVCLATGEARASAALPFFGRYLDYCTPNGLI